MGKQDERGREGRSRCGAYRGEIETDIGRSSKGMVRLSGQKATRKGRSEGRVEDGDAEKRETECKIRR